MADILKIDDIAFNAGVDWLCDRDPDLAKIIERHGAPQKRWLRPPGFATLIFIILEQQVSLASARATFNRLNDKIELNPQNLLNLNPDELKAVGLSRQKAAYSQNVARAILNQELDLKTLAALPDDRVRAQLCQLKGIGPWTADIYLMEALRRPDILPVGDLALQIAVQQVKGLEQRPKGGELEAIAEPWRPWRSVATRLCWHAYLAQKSQSSKGQAFNQQSSPTQSSNQPET